MAITTPPSSSMRTEAPGAEQPSGGSAKRTRLDSIDLLRGIVMVLMVLDHTRDYFTNVQFDPSDLSQTTPALFFTRWVTHFCAPVFMFLAGTGAYLSLARGKSKPQLAWFLATRGLWLIVIELTVVRFAMSFSLSVSTYYAIVLWAIGWSMIVLAGLVLLLPLPAIAVLGIVMIAGHNLLDGVNPEAWGVPRPLWLILHQVGAIPLPGRRVLFVLYPLVPWIGVMAAGYAFGWFFTLEPRRRRLWLLGLGLGLTAAYLLIRAVDVYGEPRKWSVQATPVYTVLSFLNATKYPPSLVFLLMTLGPAITFLGLVDGLRIRFLQPIVTFGRVPLFFFVLQWPLIHLLALLMGWLWHQPIGWLLGSFPPQVPPGAGFELPIVYAMWGVVLILLYPLCLGYARLKQRKREGWLSYL